MGAQVKRRDHSHAVWVWRVILGLLVGPLLVALFATGVAYCARHSDVTAPSTRIDWENVPVYPPATFCDLRTTKAKCITRNQAVFKRLRASEYAALAFERAK